MDTSKIFLSPVDNTGVSAIYPLSPSPLISSAAFIFTFLMDCSGSPLSSKGIPLIAYHPFYPHPQYESWREDKCQSIPDEINSLCISISK